MDHLEEDAKTGRLSYRRVYPLALRPFIPPPNVQLKRSLGATRFGAPGAVEKFNAAAALYDRTVLMAQKAASRTFDRLDGPMIAFLAETYRIEREDHDETARWYPEHRTAFVAQRSPSVGLTRVIDTATTAEHDLSFYKSLRIIADLGKLRDEWAETALRLGGARGYVFDTADPAFAHLCRAINDAAILACGTILGRQGGAVIPTVLASPRPLRPAVSVASAVAAVSEEHVAERARREDGFCRSGLLHALLRNLWQGYHIPDVTKQTDVRCKTEIRRYYGRDMKQRRYSIVDALELMEARHTSKA